MVRYLDMEGPRRYRVCMPTLQRTNLTVVTDVPGSSVQTKDASPFLKWAGGKSRLLRELRNHVPKSFQTYIEPFAGGGALFFDLLPSRAVLSDTNEDLMNAYTMVQKEVEPLITLLSTYPHDRNFYYDLRAQKVQELSPLQQAARFLYLNKCCFNGLYRVNKRNEFNVPFGRYEDLQICDAPKLRRASSALRNVTIESMHYLDLLSVYAKAGDFVYIDPPYAPVGKFSDFTRYTKDQFREKDQVELRDCIADLKRRGVLVMASNSHSEAILDLYDGFEIRVVETRRSINTNAGGRAALKEVIIL